MLRSSKPKAETKSVLYGNETPRQWAFLLYQHRTMVIFRRGLEILSQSTTHLQPAMDSLINADLAPDKLGKSIVQSSLTMRASQGTITLREFEKL